MYAHGTITNVGLGKLLAALWEIDTSTDVGKRLFRTKFRHVIDVQKGHLLTPDGSEIHITYASHSIVHPHTRIAKVTHFLIQGTIVDEDLSRIINSDVPMGIWQSNHGDELGSILNWNSFDEAVSDRITIRPSTTPPPSRQT